MIDDLTNYKCLRVQVPAHHRRTERREGGAPGTEPTTSPRSTTSMNLEDLQRLQNLREEYSKLYSLFEKHWMMPYQIIPLLVMVGGAMSIYSKDRAELWGIGVTYGFDLLMLWQAFNHAFINETGLKLVEIECRINRMTAADANSGICWHTEMIANGSDRISGLRRSVVLLTVLIVPIFSAALCVGWLGLSEVYPNHPFLCGLVIVFPCVMMTLILRSMWKTELEVRAKKKDLLKVYPPPPADPARAPAT